MHGATCCVCSTSAKLLSRIWLHWLSITPWHCPIKNNQLREVVVNEPQHNILIQQFYKARWYVRPTLKNAFYISSHIGSFSWRTSPLMFSDTDRKVCLTCITLLQPRRHPFLQSRSYSCLLKSDFQRAPGKVTRWMWAQLCSHSSFYAAKLTHSPEGTRRNWNVFDWRWILMLLTQMFGTNLISVRPHVSNCVQSFSICPVTQ